MPARIFSTSTYGASGVTSAGEWMVSSWSPTSTVSPMCSRSRPIQPTSAIAGTLRRT